MRDNAAGKRAFITACTYIYAYTFIRLSFPFFLPTFVLYYARRYTTTFDDHSRPSRCVLCVCATSFITVYMCMYAFVCV